MLDPVPRRYTVCSHLFLPRCHRPSPGEDWVGFPRLAPRITISRRHVISRLQIFLNVPASKFALPPDRSYRCILLQGSRGFYVRAYRALLPPHAPDMLTVRIQVIDGTGTFTQSDSQPCRLLTSLPRLSPDRRSGGSVCGRLIVVAQVSDATFSGSVYLRGVSFPDFRSLTPGPPPFSSM